jgi:hypothetical protein
VLELCGALAVLDFCAADAAARWVTVVCVISISNEQLQLRVPLSPKKKMT